MSGESVADLSEGLFNNLYLLPLTAVFCHTPSQSWLRRALRDWSRSEARRPWWWSHPPEAPDHLERGRKRKGWDRKLVGATDLDKRMILPEKNPLSSTSSCFSPSFIFSFIFFFSALKVKYKQSWVNSHQLLFLKFVAPSVFLTSRYPSVIQVQHPLESTDPKWNAIIKIVDAFCESKVAYFCLCTYWVNETEVKVLHAKIQQLLLLQGATEVSDNLLHNTQAWSQHENEKDNSSLKWLDSDSSPLQVNT